MLNNSQDAMAICRRLGYPDLFLTVNYLQSKIARDIKIYQQKELNAFDRPDILVGCLTSS